MKSQPRAFPYRHRLTAALLLALGGCASSDGDDAPKPIASNCEGDNDCTTQKQPLEQVDKVDILLVIDNSPSIIAEAEALKAELPRMMNAIVSGSDEDTSFPPASSVHMAVVSSDMGLPGTGEFPNCSGFGDDGVFLKPGDVGVTCDATYPGYLAFEGGPAPVATVEGVGCLPVPIGAPELTDGCGFEQPLEAALKALWPASDSSVTFRGDSEGHGDGENAGFLRDDSLLVVIVATDEDDCSTDDPSLFALAEALEEGDPLATQSLNTRCALNEDRMYERNRYIDGLRSLRADHPERFVFALIAGIPPQLVTPEALAGVDFADEQARDAFYEGVLDHTHMQVVVDEQSDDYYEDNSVTPSCITALGTGYPPRRLVKTAQAFGAQAVVGSICAEDYGATTGMLIRAIGERLTEANEAPDAG